MWELEWFVWVWYCILYLQWKIFASCWNTHLRNNAWVAGEHEGVVMTCGDQLTHDLKVINPRSGTLDSHYQSGGNGNGKVVGSSTASDQQQQQPKSHGFISLVFTTALCKNIHSSWNTLIKKHLNEERFVEFTLLLKTRICCKFFTESEYAVRYVMLREKLFTRVFLCIIASCMRKYSLVWSFWCSSSPWLISDWGINFEF